MKINSYLILILLFLCTCKNDTENINLPTFEGCCEKSVIIEEKVGNGKVYIPNAILPGIFNIDFTVFGDENITDIILLEVKDINDNVLFRKENFRPNNIDAGWDGKNVNNENRGLCTFKAIIKSSDNQERTINGFVCAIYCEGDEKIEYDTRGCTFGGEHDGEGGFRPVPRPEIDLPCE